MVVLSLLFTIIYDLDHIPPSNLLGGSEKELKASDGARWIERQLKANLVEPLLASPNLISARRESIERESATGTSDDAPNNAIF